MKPEDSSLHSQETTTYPYPEPSTPGSSKWSLNQPTLLNIPEDGRIQHKDHF
jgi:hypothetical protein